MSDEFEGEGLGEDTPLGVTRLDGSERGHPNQEYPDDLYTPITPELLQLLLRMRNEHGSWREVAALTGTKLRVLRRLYRVERKAVSHSLLDRLCVGTGVGSVREFTWFTANDLVKLGIWDPVQYLDGRQTKRLSRAERKQRKKEEEKRRRARKPT